MIQLSAHGLAAAVHDVGQVIAAAAMVSDEALDSAVIVKLTRVVLLIPLILFLARGSAGGNSIRKATPTFVFAFVACALIVNALSLPESIIEIGKESSKVLLSIGLFGMGLSVKWSQIRALGAKTGFSLGWRPGWACGAFALVVIRGVGL